MYTGLNYPGFQICTTFTTKSTFWDVTSYGSVEIADVSEARIATEMSVKFRGTTRLRNTK
jgi:hypothetical protein